MDRYNQLPTAIRETSKPPVPGSPVHMIQNTDSVDRIDDPKSKCLEKQYVYTDEPFKRTSDLASAITAVIMSRLPLSQRLKALQVVGSPRADPALQKLTLTDCQDDVIHFGKKHDGHTCTHGTTINSGSHGWAALPEESQPGASPIPAIRGIEGQRDGRTGPHNCHRRERDREDNQSLGTTSHSTQTQGKGTTTDGQSVGPVRVGAGRSRIAGRIWVIGFGLAPCR